MPKQDEVKVVPPRNDPSPLEPYAKSQALQLQGRQAGFHYEWFRPDQVEQKLRRHEIGDHSTGYLMVDPWEVVDDTQGVTTGRLSDAAGKAVDTTITNGELILLRTPDSNYAKYAVIETKRQSLIENRLIGGEKHSFNGQAGFKTRTSGGRQGINATTSEILNGV